MKSARPTPPSPTPALDIQLLQGVLASAGIMGVYTGAIVNIWLPGVYMPAWLYLPLSIAALVASISPAIWRGARKKLPDIGFTIWLLGYLGLIFIAYANHLSAGFVPLLVAAQLGFGLVISRFSEYLIFAIASVCLFLICTLGLPNIISSPNPFIAIILLATVSAGVLVRVRKFFVGRLVAQRKKQEQELIHSELRYRTLVEMMNEGLVLTDPNETILFVNNRLCEILGVARAEIVGQKSYEVLQGENVSDVIQAKSELRQKGISDQYELKLRRKNGNVLWVLVAGSPYVDVSGKPQGSIAIITDITDRKATEIKLQEKNNELDGFVYKASHDLRGPLASIIGLTHIARDEVKDPAAHRYFDLIARSTKRLDSILSELLDVTRMNKAALKPELIRLHELAQEVVGSLRHQSQAQGLSFRIEIAPELEILSDKKLLTSILQNLIANGVNYHDPESPAPFVEVSAQPLEDHVRISVTDNGIGIPEKFRQKVFEMFFRGNAQSKGSGLGLYIVKNSVSKLRGSIELHPREGGGTRFDVILPERIEVGDGQ
ncbi:MAG: PAS domain S-box protein [Bacteroidetes bacterium]|nr:MAG: PAS domain S-box protein [Bacteroidota bacterium]